ncbi:hypothetical protein [Muriicola sp. Z0-33]|uniref:TapB family protein n=1 Tax=Muriicola sp. Z0-33 TaxID=2816957 RepID=UPI00223730BF|nr:hypothetical protein [Muriicola sp. Z0-33]MCW5517899.1 hypothetical protein [Muriicola sp. Z0-33]
MKSLLALCVLLFIIMPINAQDCSKYYPLEEGTTFQITNYEKKDKVAGVIDYVVKSSSGDSAILSYEMRDDKGEVFMSSEYGIICKDDGIAIDFKSLMSPGVMNQYKDMEVDISGTDLVLPNNLSPGQQLPDADILMNVSVPPMNMKLTVKMLNRNVEANETVTTPAGTFDCVVITYDHETKMGMKISGKAKQWFAEDVGMVKSESYNKKGKLIGSSVLTAFNK